MFDHLPELQQRPWLRNYRHLACFDNWPLLIRLPRGVLLKLLRAEQHMRALNTAIDAFIKTEPYALRREVEFDGLEHVYKIDKITDAPDQIGLLSGDAAHCIRSALDHLAYAVAEKGVTIHGRGMTDREFRTVHFPIADTKDRYATQINKPGMLHIDQSFFTLVEPLQPFNKPDGRPVELNPLWNVSELDNTDKHRTVNTTGFANQMVKIMNPDLPRYVPVLPTTRPREWELNAEVWRWRFDEPYPEVDMKLEPEFSVALKDSPELPIIGAVRAFEVWLSWILERIFWPASAWF